MMPSPIFRSGALRNLGWVAQRFRASDLLMAVASLQRSTRLRPFRRFDRFLSDQSGLVNHEMR